MSVWNAALYESFSKERVQPSIDLVNRIDKECKRILDVGCGSGMSTIILRKKYPNAEIVGVDLSKEMLKKARETDSSITWIQRDCSKDLSDLGKFDLVFSNAFLQWLDDQESFIKNIKTCVADDGIIAMQIPDFDNMEISKVIKRVAKEFDPTHTLFSDKISVYNHTMEEYFRMFSSYYSNVEVWKTNYGHILYDYKETINFLKSTALMPYLDKMNEEDKTKFINRLYEEAEKIYKPVFSKDKKYSYIFTFERLFYIARV